MKVVIAGSRTIDDKEYSHYAHLLELCADFEKLHGKITMVVSGMARGPDKLGVILAKDFGLHLAEFPAQWDMHGRSAGIVRNREMARFADAAIIMWDGESRGTKHMIDIMESLGKPSMVVLTAPIQKYKHQPDGAIKIVTDFYMPMDDPAYDY